jgi:pilus assembly protein CpaB
MLTIVLAAVLGLFGVVAVVAYAHQANQRALAGQHVQHVFITTQSIPADTKLSKAEKKGWLTPEKVPVKNATDAVNAANTQNGQLVTIASVPRGQMLLQAMVGNSADASLNRNGLSGLPSTLSAVAVNVCLDEAVAEYATPGTRVAVFDTIVKIPGSGPQRTCDAQRQTLSAGALAQAETLLVMTNIQVLAVGQNPNVQNTSSSNIGAATADPISSASSSSSSSSGEVLVTLAVNQAEAEQLIKIEELGMPYLAVLGQTAKMTPGAKNPLFRGSNP